MEVYTLGPDNKLEEVVEHLESFIWTEKFQEYGNFEMTIQSTPGNRALYVPNRRIVQSNSTRIMRIEYVEDSVKDGKRTLTIKGRSLESLLTERLARSSTTTHPYNWKTTRTPAAFMRNIYREMVFEGHRSVRDIYPDIDPNEVPESGSIPEPSEAIQFEEPVQELYGLMTKLAKAYDLGFRIDWHRSGYLMFRVYSGRDRSSLQTTNSPVLFSISLDNLTSSTHIIDSSNYRNHALVATPHGMLNVFAPNISASVSGVARRTMLVSGEALEGTPTSVQIAAYHRKIGLEALSGARNIEAFDGEVTQFSEYQYGRDYSVGDVVELQSEMGHSTLMRVSEQIFTLDAEGYKSYPTLALYLYVQPGSWFDWDSNKKWDEMGATEYWKTMP